MEHINTPYHNNGNIETLTSKNIIIIIITKTIKLLNYPDKKIKNINKREQEKKSTRHHDAGASSYRSIDFSFFSFPTEGLLLGTQEVLLMITNHRLGFQHQLLRHMSSKNLQQLLQY